MHPLEFEIETLNGQQTETINEGPAKNNELKMEIVDSEKAFESLASHWQQLAKRTDATIFMTHEWALAWWRNFGRNKRRSLCIVTIWDDNTLVGLAPFYKGYSSFGKMEVEKRLQIIGSGGSPNEQWGYMDDYGISDFLDILVDEGYFDTITEMLCNIISQNQLNVNVVTFHQARNDSYIIQTLYPKLKQAGMNLNLQHSDTCPYIVLKDQTSLKSYIKSVKSSARRRFRQSIRSLKPKGDLEMDELTTWPEVEKAVETMIDLHQERWNKIGFPGVFYDERFTSFFKETVRYSFDNGWLWFKQIKDEEGVCAARLLLRYNGRYYDYISGFDDTRDSAKYRPGITLLVEAVEDAINGSSNTIELLRGQEGYKYDFTTEDFKNWKLSVELENSHGKTKKAVNKAAGILALLYKRVSREARLVKVQYSQNGLIKMLPGYISFRWNSMKMKLNS
ncbi:MAG: GNAT family N-acetyltransferase [Balneolaceae bacterium]